MASLVLYDIPGNCHEDKTWSPNVWKIRFILNLKQLPYRTHWVEYPDIAALATRIGAPPSAKRRDGSPYYTVPILYDPARDNYISDSIAIARYLDRTFPSPNTPSIFPPHTDVLLEVFEDTWTEKVLGPMFPLVVPKVHEQLNPASQPYFRRTREAMLKSKLEDMSPPAREPELLQRLEKALGRFDHYLRAGGGIFVAGAHITYADVVMAGWLVWMRRCVGQESNAWKQLESWHGGRWAGFMAEFTKLEYTEEGPGARL